jgi:hypothetical protein
MEAVMGDAVKSEVFFVIHLIEHCRQGLGFGTWFVRASTVARCSASGFR